MTSSSRGSASDDALNRLLRTLLADREAGGLRDLEAYRAEFPELGERVALELRQIGGGSARQDGPPEPGAAGLAVGDVLGDYRLLAELGRGGQGTVFLAEDRRLGRRVALKLLPALSGWSPAARARFEREAQIAAALDHPGLCPVYEAGELQGVPFVAMRHIEGRTFAQLFAETRGASGSAGLAPGRAALLVAHAARALHAAHEAGFVHRDIKPGNLMVEAEDRVSVLDFGLAREVEGDSSLTRTGEVFGTPRYMAPEQIDAACGAVSPRTDVWALGAVLYEALAGHPPFEEAVREALYRAILSQQPAALRAGRGGVSRDLLTVLETALAKHPDARYASARHLADDLEAAVEGRPIRARRTGPLGRTARWVRRSPKTAALVAGLLLAALATTGLGGYLVAASGTLRAGQLELERLERNGIVAELYGGEVSTDKLDQRLSALERWPEDVQLRAACAMNDVRNKKYDQALALLDAAPEGVAEPRVLERMRALVLRERGELEAAEQLEARLGPPEGPEEAFTASEIAALNTNPLDPTSFEPAYRLAKLALYSSPSPSSGMLASVARLALASGDLETAETVRDAMVQRFPDVSRVWFVDALIHSRFERNAEALASYERCVELDPTFSQAHFSIAVLRAFSGDLPGARGAYANALANDEEPQAKLRLMLIWSRLMHRLGEGPAALAEAERALELEPDSAAAEQALLAARELVAADAGE